MLLDLVRSREYLRDHLSPLDVVPGEPVRPQRPHDLGGDVETSGPHEVRQGATDILDLEIEGVLPASLLSSPQSGVRGVRELCVVLRVGGPDIVCVVVDGETFGRVLRDDDQHPKAGLRPRRRVQEQALVDECGQRREGCLSVFARDRPSRFDRERAAERAEPVEQVPLGLVQEVVAPVDGRTNGLLARRRIAATGRGRVERRSEVVEEHTRGEHASPSGDELDCEREAVDTTADLVRRTDVLLVPHDVGPDRADPLHEESHGVRERGDAVLVLALKPQRLATGREHLQVVGGFEQARDERSRGEQMSRSCRARAEACSSRRRRARPTPDPARATRARPRRRSPPERDPGRETVERDVDRTVGKSRSEPASRLDGEARLADAARAGQGNEAHVARSIIRRSSASSSSRPTNEVVRAGSPDRCSRSSISAAFRMEPLGQEEREIVGHERPELGGVVNMRYECAGLLFDPADELAQAVLASGRRLLDVEEHRLALRRG